MSFLRSVRPRGYTATGPLVVVLLLTLGIAGAITWIAWASAAQHRSAAQKVLLDDAEFAATNYSIEAFDAIRASSTAILAPVGMGRSSMDADRVYDLSVLERAEADLRACRCMYFDPAPLYFFRYALGDTVVRMAGDAPPTGHALARLVDSLTANFDTLGPVLDASVLHGPQLYAFVDTVAGQAQLFMETLIHGVHGTPNVVYGFTTAFRTYTEAVLPLLLHAPLVPRSLAHGLPNDSLLTVTVRDANGHVLYRSGALLDTTYAATQSLWRFLPAGPRVQIAIRPDAARRLLRGGIPPSRIPLLVALLLCTGALVLVALRLVQRAQELERLRSDFTSNVSHELRTPLAQILLFVESLQFGRVATEPERADALRIIHREARRLAHLVDNVLLFSRAERRRATRLAMQMRELAPIVREVVQSFEPLAHVRGATLRTALDDRVRAPVDPGALRQVLTNLVDNAVKYGPPGQTVVVGLARDGDRARLWVDDEGNGIREADQPRIWEPFVRLESGEYSVSTGSGIGLSVVHQLVALHGGSCHVARSPSGGARLIVELPGATVRADAPAPAADVVARAT